MVLESLALILTLLSTLMFVMIIHMKGSENYWRFRFIKVMVTYLLMAFGFAYVIYGNYTKESMVNESLEFVGIILPYIIVDVFFTIYYNELVRMVRSFRKSKGGYLTYQSRVSAHYVNTFYLACQLILSMVTLI